MFKGDSLTFHRGMKFSTKDRHHDTSYKPCTDTLKGAWWFKNCHYSHLNGVYKDYSDTEGEHGGIVWKDWKGYKYSLKSTVMKIKPH